MNTILPKMKRDEEEVRLEDGGYIPSSDHGGITEDISWQNFIEYNRLLARLTGWI